MSHFLGTPSHSRVWALKHSQNLSLVNRAKALRKRLLSGPTVDIYVGSQRKHWSLHKNLLCHHSSYFETEFQGHEVPKKEHLPSHNTLELPDDDPRGFELLVKWLYQGHLDDVSHMTDEAKYDYAVACHQLYRLCDKFDMLHVKNLAMDAYRQNLHAAQLVPDAEEINDIYRASPRGSPFRKLMIKIAARQIMDPHVDKDADTYRVCFNDSADFAVEMVNEIRSMTGGMLFDDPTKEDKCHQWHDHRDGSSCQTKGKAKAHVYVDQGSQRTPGSNTRTTQPLLLAELSERPTPRKLNVTPATPKTPILKRTPESYGSANGKPLSPANKTAAKSNTAPNRSPPKLAHANGSTGCNSTKPFSNGPKRVSIRSYPSYIDQFGRRAATSDFNDAELAKLMQATSVGPSDQASSVASGPRKLSHVKGIVVQLDSINGMSDGAQTSGAEDASDGAAKKAPPPKLKRKAPG